ncbi:MAG: RDD family protein [Ideonella sp.]|nr:RDD family protein [Ideonella sp.]
MLYESVLLFGVIMVVGLLHSTITQQRDALQGSSGLQATVFLALGIYFAGFWSASGQTLAMKTWHIRLQTTTGTLPRWPRAAARYVASWLWFLPALASAHAAGVHSSAGFAVIVAAGMLAYSALAWLRPDRQWPHDVLCGTRLVDTRSTRAAPAQSAA